ncbi:hypothetical protein J6590_104980 [Homalodisca vitripennis]|nr:hypothetical protein J6590_104980 [Homalodisca vitripennis]
MAAVKLLCAPRLEHYMRQLHLLEPWLTKWRIKVNVDKCEAISFTRTRRQADGRHLSSNGDDIPWKTSVKYLGVLLDSKLTFTPHVKEDLWPSEEGLRQHRPPAQLHEATDQDEGPSLHGSDTINAHICGPSMVPPHLQDRKEAVARCPERVSPAGHWVALVREEHRSQGFVQCPYHQELRRRPDIEP